MMMWSSSRMSNNAAARATRSVSILSCATAPRRSRRVVVHQNQLRGEQFQRPFDDQPVVDDRAGHPALTDAVTLDNAVRRGEVDDPALLVAEAFPAAAGTAAPHRRPYDDIRSRNPRKRQRASEFRRGQAASAHASGPVPRPCAGGLRLVADTRQRTVASRKHHSANCSSSVSRASSSRSLKASTPRDAILSRIFFIKAESDYIRIHTVFIRQAGTAACGGCLKPGPNPHLPGGRRTGPEMQRIATAL